MHHSRLVGGLTALAVLLIVLMVPAAAPAGTRLPPANKVAAHIAKRYLGVPYLAGGVTKAGLDDPGLARLVYRKAGIWLPRHRRAQAKRGVNVTRDQLRPGDLVFFSGTPGRVGIFVGHGSMISVRGPGTVVSKTKIDWTLAPTTLRRYDARTGYHAAMIARRYLGVPYVYGGASPSGFDASGLTMYVYAHLGVALSHGATEQQLQARPIAMKNLRRGDLVFFGNRTYSYHVGIYMGQGKMIDAPHTGAVVSRNSITGAWIGGRLLPVR